MYHTVSCYCRPLTGNITVYQIGPLLITSSDIQGNPFLLQVYKCHFWYSYAEVNEASTHQLRFFHNGSGTAQHFAYRRRKAPRLQAAPYSPAVTAFMGLLEFSICLHCTALRRRAIARRTSPILAAMHRTVPTRAGSGVKEPLELQ